MKTKTRASIYATAIFMVVPAAVVGLFFVLAFWGGLIWRVFCWSVFIGVGLLLLWVLVRGWLNVRERVEDRLMRKARLRGIRRE